MLLSLHWVKLEGGETIVNRLGGTLGVCYYVYVLHGAQSTACHNEAFSRD